MQHLTAFITTVRTTVGNFTPKGLWTVSSESYPFMKYVSNDVRDKLPEPKFDMWGVPPFTVPIRK